MAGRPYSVKRLSERFARVNFSDASRAAEEVLFENEAFTDIKEEEEEEEDGEENIS